MATADQIAIAELIAGLDAIGAEHLRLGRERHGGGSGYVALVHFKGCTQANGQLDDRLSYDNLFVRNNPSLLLDKPEPTALAALQKVLHQAENVAAVQPSVPDPETLAFVEQVESHMGVFYLGSIETVNGKPQTSGYKLKGQRKEFWTESCSSLQETARKLLNGGAGVFSG